MDETAIEVVVAIYRVEDFSNPQHRYKVDINAAQLHLTGKITSGFVSLRYKYDGWQVVLWCVRRLDVVLLLLKEVSAAWTWLSLMLQTGLTTFVPQDARVSRSSPNCWHNESNGEKMTWTKATIQKRRVRWCGRWDEFVTWIELTLWLTIELMLFCNRALWRRQASKTSVWMSTAPGIWHVNFCLIRVLVNIGTCA